MLRVGGGSSSGLHAGDCFLPRRPSPAARRCALFGTEAWTKGSPGSMLPTWAVPAQCPNAQKPTFAKAFARSVGRGATVRAKPPPATSLHHPSCWVSSLVMKGSPVRVRASASLSKPGRHPLAPPRTSRVKRRVKLTLTELAAAHNRSRRHAGRAHRLHVIRVARLDWVVRTDVLQDVPHPARGADGDRGLALELGVVPVHLRQRQRRHRNPAITAAPGSSAACSAPR
jgi:hypothetical protein